jgi:hypothetical protein
MRASASLHKRQTLLFIALFITFSAFTTDVIDLREELCFLSSPYGSLDSSVSNGIISQMSVLPEPTILLSSVKEKTSLEISFLHLLSYGFRAPPSYLS